MDQVQKQPHEELKEFLNSIPAGDVEMIKKQLISHCRTTPYIFRNWRLGITKIPILERSVMNTVSNALTGKTIFKSEL